MNPSAIVQRELIVAGRRPSTYRARCLLAALMSLVAAAFLTFSGSSGPGSKSRDTFNTLVWVAFAGALAGGVFLTADALSSERREGTLGLLFLTELTGFDVAVGKLVASSVQGSYALLGVLPVLGIPLLMGGITAGEYWNTALALGATLTCSLGLGIFASAISRDAAQALGLTVLSLVVLCTVPVLVGWVLPHLGGRHPWTWAIAYLSPVDAVQFASHSGGRSGAIYLRFLGALFLIAGVGVAGLMGAAWWLTRNWRTEAAALASPPPVAHSRYPRWQRASPRLPVRRPLGGNPYESLLSPRLHPTPALRWLARLGGVAWVFFYGLSFVGSNAFAVQCFITCMFIGYALHALFKLQTALFATGRLAEEASGGGLELLLVTPLTPQSILRGHRQAIQRAIRPQQLWLTGLNVLLLFCLGVENLSINSEAAVAFAAIFMGGLVLIWLDATTIIATGALSALRFRRQSKAVAHTLLPLFLPVPVGALVLFLLATNGMRSGMVGVYFLTLQLGMCAASFLQTQRAAPALLREFRSITAGIRARP